MRETLFVFPRSRTRPRFHSLGSISRTPGNHTHAHKKLQIFTKELFALRLFLLDFTEMKESPENGIDFSAKKC